MKKLQATEMDDFPSVKKVVLRLKDDLPSTNSKTYQGVEVVRLDQSSRVNTKHSLIVY